MNMEPQIEISAETSAVARDFRANALATRREYLEMEGAYKASLALYLPVTNVETDPTGEREPA